VRLRRHTRSVLLPPARPPRPARYALRRPESAPLELRAGMHDGQRSLEVGSEACGPADDCGTGRSEIYRTHYPANLCVAVDLIKRFVLVTVQTGQSTS
jgi:hypothetical protein